ncbi:MAG TPA: hypothetical protein DDX71_06075 [Ruminococcus sp.]|nr:hypothetical protein [Ruminococcus sp.]
MIGDKGWLSARDEPNITFRPRKWERGETMPKYYLRLAEQTVRAGMRTVRKTLIVLAAGIAILNGLFLYPMLTAGFHWQKLLPLAGGTAIGAALMLVYFFSNRKSVDETCRWLQEGQFKWRTGRLDDIVGEVVDYTYDDDGRDPVVKLYAYVDGEKVPEPVIYKTHLSHSASEFLTKKTTVRIRREGELHLGSQVTLVKPIGSKETWILPQNLEFDEH